MAAPAAAGAAAAAGLSPAALAALAGGASLGGILSFLERRKGKKADAAARRKSLEELMGVELPSISDQEIELLLAQVQGEYRPELERAELLGPSATEGIQASDFSVTEQEDALRMLGELSEGGLTAGDLADAREIRNQTANAEKSSQQAILNNLAQRGVLGSGDELTARLHASGRANQRAAQASDDLIRRKEQRALQALTQRGNLASQLRTQDFGEKQTRADAKDRISQFNTNLRNLTHSRNIAALNEAQGRNLSERQRIADLNTALRNQQNVHNKGLVRQDYLDRYQRATDQANIRTGQGAAAQKGYDSNAKAIADLTSALLNLAGGQKRKETTP